MLSFKYFIAYELPNSIKKIIINLSSKISTNKQYEENYFYIEL